MAGCPSPFPQFQCCCYFARGVPKLQKTKFLSPAIPTLKLGEGGWGAEKHLPRHLKLSIDDRGCYFITTPELFFSLMTWFRSGLDLVLSRATSEIRDMPLKRILSTCGTTLTPENWKTQILPNIGIRVTGAKVQKTCKVLLN